ncbi:MAG TPA: ceramidase domain-containing protein [Terriglobales bacterium]
MRTRWIVLAAIMVAACVITAMLKPVPQPDWYHNFADARTFVGVPRAVDVLSNIPFLAVGLAGLYSTLRNRTQSLEQRWALAVLFVGLFLTGFGSGYYHLAPDNQRLEWDRLPMTLAMAGILAFLVANRLRSMPWWILPVLVIVGVGSVVEWAWSERVGMGDLRWYGLYQALTFIVATALVVMFPAPGEPVKALVFALGANVAAKLFELLDKQIFAIGGVVSGHTLKHLAAALGFIPLIMWLARLDPAADDRRLRTQRGQATRTLAS